MGIDNSCKISAINIKAGSVWCVGGGGGGVGMMGKWYQVVFG